ncbi:MAG: BatA domain-containing protein, partial [Gemmatimonadota bacterium]|nr:BatA domain-containing protein [Gemmatimonadota bacterium]
MFRFGTPSALYFLLLLPALAVFLWLAVGARRRALEQFADIELVRRLTRSVDHRARAIKVVLVVAALG